MKKFMPFCFLFGSIFLWSKNEKKETVLLKIITGYERTFRGKIGSEPITIYVKYLVKSDCSSYAHTVKGWYYFNKNRKKVAVSGYYNGGLNLFHSYDIQKEIDHFFNVEFNLFSLNENSLQPNRFNENLTFPYDGYNPNKYPMAGAFIKDGKKKKAILFKSLENNIYRPNEYMILPNGKIYNTYDIVPHGNAGTKIISASTDKKENKVLTFFSYRQRNECQSPCVGPPDEGYRVFVFDKNWRLKGIREEYIQKCVPPSIYENTLL